MKFSKRVQYRRQQKERALYVRLPHVIRNKEDVAKLFTGDFEVKPLRQSSRYCYVIFSDVEEKMKNLKATRNVRINGKRVVVAPAIIKPVKPNKVNRKKIVIPKVKEETKMTKTLFISNIKCGTKLEEIKAAIPGCVTAKMLKPYSQNSKAAMVKMESAQIAAEYLSKMREWPVVRDRKLRINPDTRKRHKKQKSKPLKIYDGEPGMEQEPKQNIKLKRKSEVLDHIVLQNIE